MLQGEKNMEPNKVSTFKSKLELEASEILSQLSEVLQKHEILNVEVPLEVEVKIRVVLQKLVVV